MKRNLCFVFLFLGALKLFPNVSNTDLALHDRDGALSSLEGIEGIVLPLVNVNDLSGFIQYPFSKSNPKFSNLENPFLIIQDKTTLAHSLIITPSAVMDDHANIRVNLYEANKYAAGANNQDAVWIQFDNMYSNVLDYYDAPKLPNQDENIATLNGQQLLSIESRSLPEAGEVVPLFIYGYRYEQYVFKIVLDGFDDNQVVLYDYYEDKSYVLEANGETIIAFSVVEEESKEEDRFELRFNEANLSVHNSAVDNDFSIYPNPTDQGSFYINTKENLNNSQLVIYNLLGQVVLRKQGLVNKEISTVGLEPNIYIVSFLDAQGRSHKRRLVINK